jgi:hypothetical protein
MKTPIKKYLCHFSKIIILESEIFVFFPSFSVFFRPFSSFSDFFRLFPTFSVQRKGMKKDGEQRGGDLFLQGVHVP